jgi:hypothetical protein
VYWGVAVAAASPVFSCRREVLLLLIEELSLF